MSDNNTYSAERDALRAYQFAHISAYYNQQKRNAYAYNRIELGDIYDRYAMRMFKLSM